MTKHEKKLKSMLNYFEVDLTGVKDEKLSKDQLKNFLDRFNRFMDYYILEEIIKNIKKGSENKSDENDSDSDSEYEDDDEDPMLPKKNKKQEDYSKQDDNIGEELDSFNLNDPITSDINKFLRWLTLVLYSGEHTVVITEDKNGINIKLIKINKGKK